MMVNLPSRTTQQQQSRIRMMLQMTAKNEGLRETKDGTLPQNTGIKVSEEMPKDWNDSVYRNSIIGDSIADYSGMPVEPALTSLDRLAEISTKSDESLLSRVSETSSSTIIILLGFFALSHLLGDLLVQFEWLQDWRYLWPLVGSLYVADPIMRGVWRNKNGVIISSSKVNPSLLPFELSNNRGIQILSFIGGIFTLIGGAYDAFMPVWQTGPNVFTIAGIGQDGAVMLLLVTAISIVEETWKRQDTTTKHANTTTTTTTIGSNPNCSNRSLLQMLLLAELYKLGESSVDEIYSVVESMLSKAIGG